MKRFLLAFLRSLAILVGLLLIVAVAALFAALYRPQWIINDKTALLAASYAKNHGVAIEWNTLHASVASPSLLIKEVTVEIGGFCWRDEEGALRVCTDQARVSATADFTALPPRVLVIGPIRIAEASVDFDARKQSQTKAPEKSEKKNESALLLPAPLVGARLKSVNIRVEQLRLRLADRTLKGSLTLDADGDRGVLAVQGRAGSVKMDASLQLSHAQNETHGLIRARLDGLVPEVRHLSTRECRLRLRRTGDTSALNLDCPIVASVPVPPREFTRFKIPTEAGVRLTADLVFDSWPPSSDAKVKGTVGAELAPVLAPLFRGSGEIRSTVAGVPDRFPEGWRLNTDIALQVDVPSFSKAVAELRSTPWAVPAPFQVLKGGISLAARGKIDGLSGAIPLSLKTDLASKDQRLKIDASGQVRLPQSPEEPVDVQMDVVLSDVRLVLPRLDLAKPPTLFPDSRIRTSRAKEAPKGAGIHTVFTLRTLQANPVRLVSNLAAQPVPVALDFRSESGKPLQGRVKIQDFPLQLFRRDARVDHFDLTLAEPSERSPINGKIEFKYTDYTLQLLLLGTTGKPQLLFQSDPPLPQEQLMSVLLFGEPLETLDPDRLSSVGNAQAALADGALNLASIYALASTPIQSIGYDPQKGIATMKVRLAEGTSLNVGASSSEVQEIGVRKRIGPNWTVTTQVENSAASSERSVSAFLEWALRY